MSRATRLLLVVLVTALAAPAGRCVSPASLYVGQAVSPPDDEGAGQRVSPARVRASQGPGPAAPEPARAWRLVDLASGRVLDEGRPGILEQALPPGSVVKVATLIAALEGGVITPRTRMACPGAVTIGGRRIACLHPRIRRPLLPDEALAHSCNVFFASLGERLPRARLDRVLVELGLPPAPASAAAALAATGIAASPVAPQALLRAMARVLADPPGVNMRAPTRATVMRGLRGAARFGTAAVFSARGVDALAKTGTASSPAGGQHGIVVAAWPATRPARAAVVVVAGGSGPDAADLAVRLARDGRLPPVPAGSSPAGESSGPTAPREPGPPPQASAPSTAPAPPPAPPRAAPTPGPPAERPGERLVVRVGQARGKAYVTRDLPLDDYVAHVLAGEAAPRSTPAALETLAITARTFALANRGRHARDGFDLCDLTHCQVLRPPYAAARTAAALTSGLVLAWQGGPAQVFYTASCGGRSERPSNVWPAAADPPFLPSRPDEGCRGEPQWSSEIAASDLARALRAAGLRGGSLRDVRVTRRTESGRVAALRLTGLTPEEISGQDLRMAVGRALGWHLVKSTQFELSRTGTGYRFRGRGFGHGVGLCVIGATRRSAEGWSRARLLETYFPGLAVTSVADLRLLSPRGTDVVPTAMPLASGEARTLGVENRPSAPVAPAAPSRRSQTRIRLLLPAQDERQRSMLTDLAEGLLQAVVGRAGRPGPTEVQVVFHPTSRAFERATRQPWWSAGSTRGSRIDLQPLAVLHERGTLEETLAHEFGHVVTAPAVRGRPLWVVEGAAMYAAGLIDPSAPEIVGARASALSCPADAELKGADSPAATKDAYARARACFARALGAGQPWYEVR